MKTGSQDIAAFTETPHSYITTQLHTYTFTIKGGGKIDMDSWVG